MQSSTTPDPGHHTGKQQNTTKHHTQESQEVSHFPANDHNATMNRHERMKNKKHENKNDLKKKHRLGTVRKKILLKGLN